MDVICKGQLGTVKHPNFCCILISRFYSLDISWNFKLAFFWTIVIIAFTVRDCCVNNRKFQQKVFCAYEFFSDSQAERILYLILRFCSFTKFANILCVRKISFTVSASTRHWINCWLWHSYQRERQAWIDVAADVRLNPTLEKHCHDDIKKWCEAEFRQLTPGQESGGKVLLCLRQHYVKKVR